MSAPMEERLIPIQGGERRGEMVTPEADLNEVMLGEPVIGFRTFLDDVVIKGPYHPISTSDTLVNIPHDLPSL